MRDSRTGWWAIAAVAAFVLVDIALVWFALSSVRSAAANTVHAREVLPTIDAGPTPEPSPAPTSVPTTEPDFTVEPLIRVFAAVDGDVAYRASTGACAVGPTALERTGDGGATWSPTMPAEVTAVQQILAEDSDDVAVVAAEPDNCAPVLARSYSQGAAWLQTNEVSSRWHLGAGQVVAPGGATSTPCADPRQLAPRDEATAAVLCADATVFATADAGATWTSSAPLDGATSLARSDDAYRVAVAGANGCAGVQVVPLSLALETGTPGGCVVTGTGDDSIVLATANDGTTWIWAGDAVARSLDGGMTW